LDPTSHLYGHLWSIGKTHKVLRRELEKAENPAREIGRVRFS
jgi:hypothetical protein